jgi:hypothetical protein
MFSPDEVVVDAELGFLLCSISHAGPRTVTRSELRDIITAYAGEPGDFQPDLPPGTPVVEEDPGDGAPPGPVNFPGAMAGAFAGRRPRTPSRRSRDSLISSAVGARALTRE